MERRINVEAAYKLLLLLGFMSISIATLAAYLTPATGFELSIYRAAPLLFWIGFGIALFLSVLVAFSASERNLRVTAYGLGGLSFMNLVHLPLIRSWYYLSKSDGLSHWGTAKNIDNNITNMWEVSYPAIFGLDIFVSKFTGFGINRSFLVVISLFILIFIIFVPLTVRLFSNHRYVVATAVFSGMLLLPINPAAVRLEPHPSSQAIFFIVAIIYLIVFNFYHRSGQITILLTLSTFTVVLLHSQQAANILILLGTIVMIQLLHFQRASNTRSSSGWPIYSQTVVLGIVFWIWVNTNFTKLFEVGVARVFAEIIGARDSVAAESVQTRSLSLEMLGGSIEELFLKVFLVSVIYCLFCGLLMGTSIVGLFGGRPKKLYQFVQRIFKLAPSATALIAYWTAGFVAVTILFIIYVLGGITDQYFRHFGFLMVTATILGALSLGNILKYLGSSGSKKIGSLVGITIMVLFLSLSIPVVFESPYVYQNSHHVTEMQMNGQKIALGNTVNENPHTRVRTSITRFEDAIYGPGSDQIRTGNVPDHFASRTLTGESDESEYYRSLPQYFNETAYLFITEDNRQVETKVYRGFRWSEKDFQYLEREPNINRVHDNGEFDLYIIRPAEEDSVTDPTEAES